MRPAGVTALLTALAALWLSTPAEAITSVQKFTMKVSPSLSGSVPTPRPASLTLRAWFDSVSPDLDRLAPFATRRAGVRLPNEMTITTDAFPGCDSSTILRNETLCPARSQVGSGSLRIVGVGLDENLSAKVFVSSDRKVKLLTIGTTPLVVRQLVPLDLSRAVGDPQFVGNPTFGPSFFATFPTALQSPAPGILAAITDLKLSFPIQKGNRPNGTAAPFVSTTGCLRGAWLGEFGAEYTTALDGAYDVGQQVTSSQPCVAGPGSTTLSRPLPTLSDLQHTQVFFRGQAALHGSEVAGRILSLNVAKVPEGAAVKAVCSRGCQFSGTRGWRELARRGGEVTWRFRKPLVIRRGARVVVSVSSSERTAKLTIGFKRRGGALVPTIARIS